MRDDNLPDPEAAQQESAEPSEPIHQTESDQEEQEPLNEGDGQVVEEDMKPTEVQD